MQSAHGIALVVAHQHTQIGVRLRLFQFRLQGGFKIGIDAQRSPVARLGVGKKRCKFVKDAVDVGIACGRRRRGEGERLVVCLLESGVVQIPLFVHEAQHQFPPRAAGLCVAEGRIAVGGLDDRGEHGALGDSELVCGLAKVKLRGALNAECAVTEVDGV